MLIIVDSISLGCSTRYSKKYIFCLIWPGFQAKPRLVVATLILLLFTEYHGITTIVNIQPLINCNLTMMYPVSYQCSNNFYSIASNVMVSLAFIQFCTIVLYRFLTYKCHYNVEIMFQNRWH